MNGTCRVRADGEARHPGAAERVGARGTNRGSSRPLLAAVQDAPHAYVFLEPSEAAPLDIDARFAIPATAEVDATVEGLPVVGREEAGARGVGGDVRTVIQMRQASWRLSVRG